MSNAELLAMANEELDTAKEENNEYGIVCALRSIAASQLVIARADVHRATS